MLRMSFCFVFFVCEIYPIVLLIYKDKHRQFTTDGGFTSV